MNLLPTPYAPSCAPCSGTGTGVPSTCPTGSIPGAKGDIGASGGAGSNGANAFTTVTVAFVVPAINASVTIVVGSTAWMAAGQPIYIASAGFYSVSAINDSTDVAIINLGYTGNAVAGTTIAIAQHVVAAGIEGPGGATGGGVTSVSLTVPSWLTVAGSPITTTGTLAVTATGGQTANRVIASPDGAPGSVALRALVANDIPNLPATKITTGTLSISQGGTGQSTQSTAYNALSPNTTKGDLTIRNGSTNVRLAVGADGTILVANSGAAEGASWQANAPLYYPAVETVVTPYFMLTTDVIIGVNIGAGSVVNLLTPPASGRRVIVKDISGAASTHNITVAPAAGDTVEGSATISTNYGYRSYYYDTVTKVWYLLGSA